MNLSKRSRNDKKFFLNYPVEVFIDAKIPSRWFIDFTLRLLSIRWVFNLCIEASWNMDETRPQTMLVAFSMSAKMQYPRINGKKAATNSIYCNILGFRMQLLRYNGANVTNQPTTKIRCGRFFFCLPPRSSPCFGYSISICIFLCRLIFWFGFRKYLRFRFFKFGLNKYQSIGFICKIYHKFYDCKEGINRTSVLYAVIVQWYFVFFLFLIRSDTIW